MSELVWFFDDVPFYGNASAGIIISNQSLVLQKVRKEHRGSYKCLATNTEGQGRSLDLLLEVRCKLKINYNSSILFIFSVLEDAQVIEI